MLVLFQGDIAVFSKSGSAWAQGTARPKGAKQMTQYGVTALNKDMPLSAACALSWFICLALNMAISP